jgi:Tfp pilus assembly protein PilF
METSSASNSRLAEMIQQGMQAHRDGEPAKAEALYAQVLLEAPEHPDALHLTGLLWAQRRQYDKAADFIGRAIAANPGETMFFNNLANVMVELGRGGRGVLYSRGRTRLESA